MGRRAARNTIVRAAGELLGKLATLLLLAVLAREGGQTELGIYVLAQSFVAVTSMPAELGVDRWLLRQVAMQREAFARLLPASAVLKTGLAVPMAVVTLAIAFAVGYPVETVATIAILYVATVVDALARVIHSVFIAVERSELLVAGIVVQRLAAAALGVGALALGHGVVAVAWAYLAGSVLGLLVAAALQLRSVGRPKVEVSIARLRRIAKESFPFAAQDILTVLLFKVDAILLSLLASLTAVGAYGAAYRLLESTFFITVAVTGAFAPMYTYLDHSTHPTIGGAFRRSLKMMLALLTPVAVAFMVLADPLARLFFGAELDAAAAPLRLLGPVVIGLGLSMLVSALVVSRSDPRVMVKLTAAIVVLNVVLNIVAIPLWDASGAALAMLVTEVVFVAVGLRIALSLIDPIPALATVAAPVVAGLAGAVPMWLLHDALPAALLVGTLVYAVAFVAIERRVAPGDLAFGVALLRDRLRGASS